VWDVSYRREVRFYAYGESDTDSLRGLERHERDPDGPSSPHVLIAETRGRRTVTTAGNADLIDGYVRDLAAT